jgi:hypothetical protein
MREGCLGLEALKGSGGARGRLGGENTTRTGWCDHMTGGLAAVDIEQTKFN